MPFKPLTKLKRLKPRVKTEGSALLISIILSSLMLTVGILAARLAVREVEFSADLFQSEKAYFSAESGVEKALWKLKNEPIAHVEATQDASLGDAHTTTAIRNLIDTTADNFPLNEFSFTLPSLASQKFRFQRDSDPGIATSVPIAITGPVTINLDSAGDLFWRILCSDASNNTEALQATINGTATITDLTLETGVTDSGVSTTFTAWSGVNKNTCYLSIQNLSSSDRTYTFGGTTMAPHAAHVHAVGEHNGRTKHIRFDYAQKSLGSLFDFSFLHTADGL